jgi:Na+/H+ antiporter NhaA
MASGLTKTIEFMYPVMKEYFTLTKWPHSVKYFQIAVSVHVLLGIRFNFASFVGHVSRPARKTKSQ